ncbi:MAG TPA: FAD-dependent oxidoreductase [Nitrospiraceae bacterium]|nr:FAD-dependent oxidoreductase [Nitrospiraceae bacterium]
MNPTALVVGSTLAGLTTALRLAKRGYTVTLLEQPKRDTSVHDESDQDALPLVLMGCHTATYALLETLGTAASVQFNGRIGLELHANRRLVRLRRPPLPAPLPALAGLAIFAGMPVRDRWRFLMWVERTWEQDPALPVDLESHTAEAWLRGIGQSEFARGHVWTPLCRFLLGDDVRTVSASALLSTLMRCFLSSRRHSHLAVPIRSMDYLLHQPLRSALIGMGVSLKIGYADRLDFSQQRVTGIHVKEGDLLRADWYIVALPRRHVTPLLPEGVLTRFSYFQHIDALVETPAVAVHLRLDQPVHSPRVLLLAERTFHWMCVKPAADDRHSVISLVMTGQSERLDRPDKDLLKCAGEDLQFVAPALSTVRRLSHRIVREPRACLSLKPGTTAQRPLQRSPFFNLLLAGEWTDTGLPSTVESAIVSGNRCAQTIVDQAGQ